MIRMKVLKARFKTVRCQCICWSDARKVAGLGNIEILTSFFYNVYDNEAKLFR
jgi:hypothetical protein